MSFLSRLFKRSGDSVRSTGLMAAVMKGDLAAVQCALQSGDDPNGDLPTLPPPLVLATVNRRFEIAQALIAAGADVNRPDPGRRMNALHAAAMYGSEEVVRDLLDQGANPNATFGSPPLTPLALALRHKQQRIAKLLADGGADPNMLISLPTDPPDQQGISPILVAASAGNVALIRALVRRGADLDLCYGESLTPLMTAAFNGELGAVRALVEAGASVNLIHAADPQVTFTALDLAVERGHDAIAEYLRAQGAISVSPP